MSKVYKTNNKLAVYIPFDVISSIGIKEGDDLDFLKYGEGTFIVAKKNDLVRLLSKADSSDSKPESKKYEPKGASRNISLEHEELALLKKLDMIRYNDRTIAKVGAVLNSSEKTVLQGLIKRGIITAFKKGNDKDAKYSIQRSVYDTFLYGKRSQKAQVSADVQQVKARIQSTKSFSPTRAWEQRIAGNDSEPYLESLESNGFVVLNNEADASMVSAALEDSIRQGLVLGTRAFNKKFYICLRGFINKNASKILKSIDQKSTSISDIVEGTGIEEDGVRSILYVLSESGDVTEVRRDIFRVA